MDHHYILVVVVDIIYTAAAASLIRLLITIFIVVGRSVDNDYLQVVEMQWCYRGVTLSKLYAHKGGMEVGITQTSYSDLISRTA